MLVEHRALGVGAGALGLDLGAGSLLWCQVAGLHAAHRRAGELDRAALDGADLFNPLLRGQQVVEGAAGGQHLLGQDVFHIGLCGTGRTLGGLGAQGALVAALPDPVQADRLVDALGSQGVAATDAVLQIDLAQLGAQHRIG